MRVEAIAEILHDKEKPINFRALHCIGFFHSVPNHSFGLIFEIPSLQGNQKYLCQQQRPISLAGLIKRTRECGPRERPSLGDKFKLAEALAASVLE